MKRSTTVAIALGLISVPFVVAATAEADTGCTALPRFVNGSPGPVAIPTDAPYGATVVVTTWDSYAFDPALGDRAHAPTQVSERLRITAGAATFDTADVPDGTYGEQVLTFTVGPIEQVTVAHLTDGSSPNSVTGEVCVVPAGAPAPTTTVAPTTVPATVPTTVPIEVIPPTTVLPEAPVPVPVPVAPSFTG